MYTHTHMCTHLHRESQGFTCYSWCSWKPELCSVLGRLAELGPRTGLLSVEGSVASDCTIITVILSVLHQCTSQPIWGLCKSLTPVGGCCVKQSLLVGNGEIYVLWMGLKHCFWTEVTLPLSHNKKKVSNHQKQKALYCFLFFLLLKWRQNNHKSFICDTFSNLDSSQKERNDLLHKPKSLFKNKEKTTAGTHVQLVCCHISLGVYSVLLVQLAT